MIGLRASCTCVKGRRACVWPARRRCDRLSINEGMRPSKHCRSLSAATSVWLMPKYGLPMGGRSMVDGYEKWDAAREETNEKAERGYKSRNADQNCGPLLHNPKARAQKCRFEPSCRSHHGSLAQRLTGEKLPSPSRSLDPMSEDEVRMDDDRGTDAVDDVDMHDGRSLLTSSNVGVCRRAYSQLLLLTFPTHYRIEQIPTSSAEEEGSIRAATVPHLRE